MKITVYKQEEGAMQELQNEPLSFEKVWAALMETRERQEKTDRQIQETNRQIGKLGNRFGDLIEHLVVPGIVDKFNDLGYLFTRHAESVKYHDPQTRKVLTEVDILLENGDVVIAVEVKSNLRTEDVDKHITRMDVLRRMADLRGDSRKYRGAIAAAITTEEAREYAQKSGFYVLEQTGDTMRLDIPPGFVPRDW